MAMLLVWLVLNSRGLGVGRGPANAYTPNS